MGTPDAHSCGRLEGTSIVTLMKVTEFINQGNVTLNCFICFMYLSFSS